MNESYAEAGVKRDKTIGSYVAKFFIIFAVLVVIFIGGPMFGSIAIMIGSVAAFLCASMFPRFNIEYEYIYCDGQLDFDRITGNAKRKNMLRIDSDSIEMIAPVNSHALDNYKNVKVIVKDFSSKRPDANVFAIISHNQKDVLKILFEPNEKMIACIKQKTPRKISEI